MIPEAQTRQLANHIWEWRDMFRTPGNDKDDWALAEKILKHFAHPFPEAEWWKQDDEFYREEYKDILEEMNVI